LEIFLPLNLRHISVQKQQTNMHVTKSKC
jgi:hypothetical protein